MRIDAPTDPAAAVNESDKPLSRPLVVSLIGLIVLVAAVLVWAVFGRAPQTVSGHGYVLPAGGYTEVGTILGGVVDSVVVDQGERVLKGQELLSISVEGENEPTPVFSPENGLVVEVSALPGRVTLPGDPMLYMQPDGAQLIVKAFVLATEAETIRVGMEAMVSPADAPRRAQYGILGTVAALSPTPVSAERIDFIVGGNSTLVDFFLAGGPVIEVTIELTPDPATPSGYAWSIGQGPDVEISSGTLSEVSMLVRDKSVLE
ncbi:MAG: HlyD family efflux transporter periplasmic adaptor subunit [Actinobacteria bacterium]|nr:HlyD family efflux transporter periplasmic adaptor subunit [Actinomycetota bacterium]